MSQVLTIDDLKTSFYRLKNRNPSLNHVALSEMSFCKIISLLDSQAEKIAKLEVEIFMSTLTKKENENE